MKLALLAVAGLALSAAQADAQPLHTASMVHEGRNMSVSYELKTKTSLKQTGVGPRMNAGCLWKTTAWVERRVTDETGQTIAALTRDLGSREVSEGIEAGRCNTITHSRTEAFGGSDAKVKAFVMEVANADGQGLRAELASLTGLDRAMSS